MFLVYEIVKLWMEWVECLHEKLQGWWLYLSSLEIISSGFICLVSCMLILMSLVWLLSQVGTRSDSVKPTGHARFSVEINRLI